jgi:hypothetical protein
MKRIFSLVVLGCSLISCLLATSNAQSILEKPEIELLLGEKKSQYRIGNSVSNTKATTVKSEKGFSALIGSKEGIIIPAASLSGKQGTIICRFKMSEAKKNFKNARYFLTLRGEGRTWIGFCFYPGSKKLVLNFRYTGEDYNVTTPEELKPETWYDAICTWDGTKVRFYLNGVIQGEQDQKIPALFPEYSKLNLGPFRDGWNEATIWEEDDIMINKAVIYNKCLSLEDIAAAGNAKTAAAGDAQAAYAIPATTLAVPKISSAPKIDGIFNDKKWAGASSFIALNDGTAPTESLSYPSSNVMFAYDDENLYVSFYSHFPRLAKIIKGETKPEQEVWSDESFEFYVNNDKDLYRFAGNVAGGFTESLNNSKAFSGKWNYKSSLRMQIDDSELWQGEIAIPFKTIGLSSPVDGKTLKVNFCRTWRVFEHEATTSLAGAASYDAVDKFVNLKFAGNAAVFQELQHNNPNFGVLKQEIQVSSRNAGKFTYSISLVNSKGLMPAEKLFEDTFSVAPNASKTLKIDASINKSYFDTLQFNLKDESNAKILMQQAIPFKISNNYLSVKPAFSSGNIIIEPKFSLLKSTIGAEAKAAVMLKDSAGKILWDKTISSDNPFKIGFARNNQAGMYKVSLYSTGSQKKIHSEKDFFYPGVGAYDSPQFDPERVLPPFSPITSQGKANNISIDMWGRNYSWQNNLFPAAITSNGQSLLNSPVELWIDGQPLRAGNIKLTKTSPARCEFNGSANSQKYAVSMNSWIEYDGVLWNNLEISARQNLKQVSLKIVMPEEVAKYIHGAKGGFGADGGFTGNTEITHELGFYPVIWLGNEAKGLAWFAESTEGWLTKNEKPIRVSKENGNIVLNVTLADAMKSGTSMKLSFGLIATPVKALPANYPLNTYGTHFAVHQNLKAPRAPTISTMLCLSDERCLRFGFYDLPLSSPEKKDLAALKSEINRAHQNNAKCISYMNPVNISEEYPEAAASREEWQMLPQRHMNYYSAENNKHDLLWLCPASKASNYFIWKVKDVIKQSNIDGLFFDFGQVRLCSNSMHGCNGRYPLLAMRDFYRGIANAFVESGKNDYVLIVHNSEAIQVPVFTFVTNMFNGEHFRQTSSDTFYNGKDILDRLTIDDFATEFSSIPWGITSSMYMPTTPLEARFGGGKEDPELYAFRMSKAFLAGSLIHNTIPALEYENYGLFDKLIRIYDGFEVPKASFVPYWNNAGALKVTHGKDIYVSAYKHHSKPELLVIISHISKNHQDQQVTVALDPAKLGLRKIISAEEMFTRDDPEYKRLLPETNRERVRVKLGDFGVTFKGLDNNRLNLELKNHSVAIVKVTGE